jgi:ABC-type nitrate/sulfonate/bicarbonate transport system substrate-binding protein
MSRTALRVVALLAAAALALFVAACGGEDEAADTAAKAPTNADEVTGKIDTAKVKKDLKVVVDNPHYLFQVDSLVALDKGYAKEFGINSIENTVTDEVVPALIGGSADIMLFDTDSIMNAAKQSGTDLRVIGMYIQQEANVLAVRKGINTVEDLKGSGFKIAVSGQGTRSYEKMVQMLEENGIDPEKDVQLVDTGGQSNERLQQIINGTVDGGSVQLRHETILKEEAGGKFLIKETPDFPQLAWGTTGEFMDKNPDTVAAFLAATIKAREDIVNQDNKDYVLKLMDNPQYDFELPQSFKDAYGNENSADYRGADGGFETARMDALIDEQKQFEVLPQDLDWHEYTDLSALWTAQKNLGLDLRPAPEEVNGQ